MKPKLKIFAFASAFALLILIAVVGGLRYGQYAEAQQIRERIAAEEAAAKTKALAEASAKAIEAAANTHVDTEALPEQEEAPASERQFVFQSVGEPPKDTDTEVLFAFAHSRRNKIGIPYDKGAERKPLFSHAICNDGEIFPLSYVDGDVGDRLPEYRDYYAIPKERKDEGFCLAFRRLDPASYKNIAWSRRRCKSSEESCAKFPPRPCSQDEKARLLTVAGHEKDDLHWCQYLPADERLSFVKTFSQSGKTCNQRLWVSHKGVPRVLSEWSGRIGVDAQGIPDPNVKKCTYGLGDGDFTESELLESDGSFFVESVFELNGKTYFTFMVEGSEGYALELYEVLADTVEKKLEYYDYSIDSYFWISE